MRLRAALCLLASSSGPAFAEAVKGEPIITQLLLEASDCATTEQVQAQVQARSRRITFQVDSPERRVWVRVFNGKGGERLAALTFERPGMGLLDREIRATTCDELVQAVGLVIAVTLDPPSLHGNIAGSSEPPQRASRPTEPPQREAPRSESDRSPAPERLERIGRRGAAWERHALVGAGGRVQQGPGGGALYGGHLVMGITAAPLDDSWAGRLSARLELGYSLAPEQREVGGVASFELYAAQLHLCPISLGNRAISLSPCGLISGGALRVRGAETNDPQTRVRPWLLMGASLLMDVRLMQDWVLSPHVALGAPLVRDEFQFEPIVFGSVPLWAVQGGLNFAAIF